MNLKNMRERHKDQLRQIIQNSHVRRPIRDPAWQQAARGIVERYPGLRRFARTGESDGALVARTLRRIADPEQLRANLRDFGLPSSATHADLIEAVCEAAPEVGATPSELKANLAMLEQLEMRDLAILEVFKQDAAREGPSLEDLPLREDERAKLVEEEGLRNTISSLYGEAERETELYNAASSLHADVERALEAHSGRHSRVDPASHGAREWDAAHPIPQERENLRARFEQTRRAAEADARETAEYESRFLGSGAEAQAVAQAGGDSDD